MPSKEAIAQALEFLTSTDLVALEAIREDLAYLTTAAHQRIRELSPKKYPEVSPPVREWFDVSLVDHGSDRDRVYEELLKLFPTMHPLSALSLIDNAPSLLLLGAPAAEANRIATALRDAGAIVCCD